MPPTSPIEVPSIESQSIVGCGLPEAEQSSQPPDEFENSNREGGSMTNCGPRSWSVKPFNPFTKLLSFWGFFSEEGQKVNGKEENYFSHKKLFFLINFHNKITIFQHFLFLFGMGNSTQNSQNSFCVSLIILAYPISKDFQFYKIIRNNCSLINLRDFN